MRTMKTNRKSRRRVRRTTKTGTLGRKKMTTTRRAEYKEVPGNAKGVGGQKGHAWRRSCVATFGCRPLAPRITGVWAAMVTQRKGQGNAARLRRFRRREAMRMRPRLGRRGCCGDPPLRAPHVSERLGGQPDQASASRPNGGRCHGLPGKASTALMRCLARMPWCKQDGRSKRSVPACPSFGPPSGRSLYSPMSWR